MAPSAAPLTKQRYTAGNCTLNLTLQPSALSKWYPQQIAQQVAFELWMANAASEEPMLLAKGDRTLLQAITRYIEHRTQATLTVGQMANNTVGQPRSTTSTATAAQTIPPLPANVQLPQPLSYLQLCDLSSVLAQSEQAAKTLPVSLDITPAVPAKRPPKSRNNLLFFPTGRRAAWASSAAAALFAVGLTTTLWNSSNSPEPASVAETDLANPETTGNSDDRLRLKKPTENELSAGLPSSTARNSTPLGQPAPRLPVPATRPPSSGDQSASAPSNQSEGSVSPNSPAPASPSPSRSTTSAEQSIPQNSPAGSSIRESASVPGQGAADNSNGTNAPQEETLPENTSQDNASANESADASEDITVATAPAPAIARSPDNALDRKITNAEQSAVEPDNESLGPAALSDQSAEADLPDLESAPSQAAARRLGSETEGAIATQESETLTQVQNYFLGQWNAENNLSAPLSYQLQLSSLGGIVSFSAITEGGDVYRDRLLPDSSITFPPSNSAALANGLTLKITVTPDGQVQVEKL